MNELFGIKKVRYETNEEEINAYLDAGWKILETAHPEGGTDFSTYVEVLLGLPNDVADVEVETPARIRSRREQEKANKILQGKYE